MTLMEHVIGNIIEKTVDNIILKSKNWQKLNHYTYTTTSLLHICGGTWYKNYDKVIIVPKNKCMWVKSHYVIVYKQKWSRISFRRLPGRSGVSSMQLHSSSQVRETAESVESSSSRFSQLSNTLRTNMLSSLFSRRSVLTVRSSRSKNVARSSQAVGPWLVISDMIISLLPSFFLVVSNSAFVGLCFPAKQNNKELMTTCWKSVYMYCKTETFCQQHIFTGPSRVEI